MIINYRGLWAMQSPEMGIIIENDNGFILSKYETGNVVYDKKDLTKAINKYISHCEKANFSYCTNYKTSKPAVWTPVFTKYKCNIKKVAC